jgi:hypothetical protein
LAPPSLKAEPENGSVFPSIKAKKALIFEANFEYLMRVDTTACSVAFDSVKGLREGKAI